MTILKNWLGSNDKSRGVPGNLMRATIVCLPLLSLAACDSADNGPKTAQEIWTEVKQFNDQPEPGMYTQTIEQTNFQGPQGNSGVLAPKQTTNFCMTKDQSQDFPKMFEPEGMSDDDCKYERFDVSQGSFDTLLICSNGERKTSRMRGTFSKLGGTINLEIENNPTVMMSQQPRTITITRTFQISLKRIGNCKL